MYQWFGTKQHSSIRYRLQWYFLCPNQSNSVLNIITTTGQGPGEHDSLLYPLYDDYIKKKRKTFLDNKMAYVFLSIQTHPIIGKGSAHLMQSTTCSLMAWRCKGTKAIPFKVLTWNCRNIPVSAPEELKRITLSHCGAMSLVYLCLYIHMPYVILAIWQIWNQNIELT